MTAKDPTPNCNDALEDLYVKLIAFEMFMAKWPERVTDWNINTRNDVIARIFAMPAHTMAELRVKATAFLFEYDREGSEEGSVFQLDQLAVELAESITATKYLVH
jgi:hypothetical protein